DVVAANDETTWVMVSIGLAVVTAPSNRTLSLLLVYHPAPTGNYTLSLHDALPISGNDAAAKETFSLIEASGSRAGAMKFDVSRRSEEHTSELQSRYHLVCRLLLEKRSAVRIRR